MTKKSAALLLGSLLSAAAWAGPADYIYLPNVAYGEREIDLKFGASSPLAGNSAQAGSIGFGYGAREHWFTELYLKHERIGNAGVTLAEWENKFQLTETGEYPLDIGLITELETPLNGKAPNEIRLGPLLQTELGKLQLNGNLLFQRSFGPADETGVPYTTNLAYQWQAKYRWQPVLEFGMQGYSEMGKWNDWSQQANMPHQFGPAVFGKFKLVDRQVLKYNAAWLHKTNSVTPNHTLRMQIEYEF